MKARKTLFATGLALVGILATGCGESVPANPVPKDGSNPHVSGSPEERIKALEGDATLTPEEKARRIGVIKERNHIQ